MQDGLDAPGRTPRKNLSYHIVAQSSPLRRDFRKDWVPVMPVTVCHGLHRRHTVRHMGSRLHRGAPLGHILNLLQADRNLWTWHQEHSRRAVLNSHKGQSTADVRHQHCRVQQRNLQTFTWDKGSSCGA